MTTITIDNNPYELESLPEEAKTQLMSLQVTDQEIRSLQIKLAIAQTARLAYANELKKHLPANA